MRRHSSRGWTRAPPPRTSRSTRCCSRARRPTPPGPGPRRGRRPIACSRKTASTSWPKRPAATSSASCPTPISRFSGWRTSSPATTCSGSSQTPAIETDGRTTSPSPSDVTASPSARAGNSRSTVRPWSRTRERDRRRAARSAAVGRHPDQARRLLIPRSEPREAPAARRRRDRSLGQSQQSALRRLRRRRLQRQTRREPDGHAGAGDVTPRGADAALLQHGPCRRRPVHDQARRGRRHAARERRAARSMRV